MTTNIKTLIDLADDVFVNNVQVNFFDSSTTNFGTEPGKYYTVALANDDVHYVEISLLDSIEDFGKVEPGCVVIKDSDGTDLKFKFMVNKPLCLDVVEQTT